MVNGVQQFLGTFGIQINAVIHVGHFDPGISEKITHRVIEKSEIAVDIKLIISIRGGFNDPPVAFLAVSQHLLGYLAPVYGVLGVGTKDNEQT
jgi:hypothetical protein